MFGMRGKAPRRRNTYKSQNAMNRIAKKSGVMGETTVASVLSMLSQEYIVFNNVLLKWKSRQGMRSSQIDHVIVSPYGLFVIETKNHKGVILGDIQNEVWTQLLTYSRQRFTFRNPFFQNQSHLNSLEMQLGIGQQFMCGIVVFASPEVDISGVNAPCITVNCLYDTIMRYRTPVWSAEQTYSIASNLSYMNKSSKWNDARHVKYVKGIASRRGN